MMLEQQIVLSEHIRIQSFVPESIHAPNLTQIMSSDVEQAPKALRGVVAPAEGCFWIKRRAGPITSRSRKKFTPIETTTSGTTTLSSRSMETTTAILVSLLLVTLGMSVWAIASDTPDVNSVNVKTKDIFDEEFTIQSRSDYPDLEDLSTFFDFEIGPTNEKDHIHSQSPPSSSKGSSVTRTYRNKHYYYYNSGDTQYPSGRYYSVPKEKLVTPGSHYKSPTETSTKANDSESTISQAIVGPYQVSVVDAKSPMLSKLGFSQEDLERLSGYSRRSTTNSTMLESDSVPPATYAEDPRSHQPYPGYPSSHSQPPKKHAERYESSKYPSYSSNRPIEREYRPNEYYPPETSTPHRGYYSAPPANSHPPPQGSYDAKSYKAVQDSTPRAYSTYHHQPSNYNQYPPPPPPPAPSSTSSYSPKRSPSEPWRHSPSAHTDWDDTKPKKQESWQGEGPYPPHPPPLPYSSTPSNSEPHQSRPSYNSQPDKPSHRYATYHKPEVPSKSGYSPSSSISSSSSDYHVHKPSYYPPSSTYSSSSKVPSRSGSVSYGSSSHHHPPPGKPGITIRFKAKSPGHHGLNIPLNFNPLEVVKKLIPLSALNPLNNKKVTIGITIENKKEHHDYHSY